jgi:ATP-dependent DNA helicase DinG
MSTETKLFSELKYDPRPEQLEALDFVKTNLRKGKRFFMMNLPTGVGKSFFNIMFINWYLQNINEDAKFDVLTNTKILQTQYTNEFPFMASLKGQNSYMCNTWNSSCQEGKEMNRALKKKCDNCPYDRALSSWITSKVSLTNFHLFNTFSLFLPTTMEERNSNVLIVDEAHDFESVLCDFITMKISQNILRKMGFNETKTNTILKKLEKIKTLDKYVDFLDDFLINEVEKLIDKLGEKIGSTKITNSERLTTSKQLKSASGHLSNYNEFLKDYKENPDNWVFDVEEEQTIDKYKKKIFVVQPVWSYKYLDEKIWSKYDHIIFLSGTIIDKTMFSYLNGIDDTLSCYHEIDSPFPLKNRPIYYIKAGKMTFHEKTETFKKQIKYLDKIIERNNDKKGIIHTANYEIAGWLRDYYENNKRFVFHSSETRDEALLKHTTSNDPTIIVSPSMMNGVDLNGDLSRFQIIMKMPFPNLKSNKIKKRMTDYKEWYSWKTVVDVIQSYGRSIRGLDDWAETYIIDEAFSNVMKFNYKYIPQYILNAVKLINTKKK